ncbi:FadR/GntR family transcriptional regulator [Denitromonas iodatirespirans]|uniref:FadR family transcriptional regulator n=1 Tax=Denitromonas iodatirespirans TaxID=2795389 RepID=A0A944DBT9_DENI1|nr:FadR/GntR family transcriptional regulator [Denitromonas iodatirespirans]MBT0959838.1 FadR family transcriptional regulator [Denitromonas iodatirespirans]
MSKRHPPVPPAAAPSPAAIAPAETRVDNAVRAITDYIHGQGLKVDDSLPSEARFAEWLGVSRTVIREAFKSLSAIRIIEMRAGRRARVGGFDGSVIALSLTHALRTEQISPQQMWDARRAVERRTVALAASRRSDAEAAHLLALVEQMRDARHDLARMTEHDIAFHVAIANATRNPLFPVLVASLTSAMRETNPMVWRHRRDDEARLDVVRVHEDIARAIAAGDPDAACAALDKHFDLAAQALLTAGFS